MTNPKPADPNVSRTPQRCCRGLAALEFAFVLPILLLALYSMVAYGLILVAKNSLTLAAAEGARAGLVFQTGGDTAARMGARTAHAKTTCETSLGWLKSFSATAVSCSVSSAVCTADTRLQCITVTATYNYPQAPLVPSVPLMDGLLPQAPLQEKAVSQISPLSLS